jgi:hypothetical protein
MAYEKKYESYEIKITYENGDIENIEYNGVNTSNWREMLRLYNDVKDQYSNKSVLIEFIGKSNDGELKVIYNKNLLSNNGNEETKEENKNCVVDTVKMMIDGFELLTKEHKRMMYREGFIQKQQDFLLHKIEAFEENNFGAEESIRIKLELFDQLEELRKERRIMKNEKAILDNFFKLDKNCINNVQEKLTTILKHHNKQIEKINSIDLYDDNFVEENIVKRIDCNSAKYRDNLIPILSKKYDKVTYNNNQILCYNYGYTKNALKQAK